MRPSRNNRRLLNGVIAGMILLLFAGLSTLVGHRLVSARIRELIQRSKNREPFGLGAFNEEPLAPAQVWLAERYVLSDADATAYHLLVVLRIRHPDSYARVPARTKAAILCSALATIGALNDWGSLGPGRPSENFSAQALVELGREALPYLRPMLDNLKAARLGGSIEATMSEIYQYRRADFAYNYACLILHLLRKFHPDPRERDKDIDLLKARFDDISPRQGCERCNQ